MIQKAATTEAALAGRAAKEELNKEYQATHLVIQREVMDRLDECEDVYPTDSALGVILAGSEEEEAAKTWMASLKGSIRQLDEINGVELVARVTRVSLVIRCL